ncbi:MAG TPA: CHAT domain-containing protein [Pseudonocardiaceae bacterium]|jgi:tetratricopeptide (TPR) repeat protein
MIGDVSRRHDEVLALVERGRLAEAADGVRRLIRRAERAGHAGLPQFRLTHAWIELDRGRLAGCARQLAAARPGLSGGALARADCLAGLLRCAAGEYGVAVDLLTAALPELGDDRRWTANALVGRGTAHGYLRRLREADADFAFAATHYAALGERARAAACVHNRGFVALQAGDLPLALRRFDEAEARGVNPARHPEAMVDRAQALVAAGLTDAARPVLARAAVLLADAGRGTKLAEATLALAHCAARAGQADIAVAAAGRAALLFGRQGRTSWRPAARAVELAVLGGPASVVRRVAAECDRHGWALSAAELRFAAADHAPPEVAVALLAEVAERRHSGPAPVRALGWLARARLAEDRRAVFAACRAGLRAVRRDAATMGAWELRAGMAGHTVELAELGLRAALAGGRARTVLRWTDACRAVDRPAVLPPADPEQARRLVALRSAVSSGRSPGRVRLLERRVRALDLAGAAGDPGRGEWTFAGLVAALGDTALVSFLVHDGYFCAVSVVDGRCRFHRLALVPVVADAVRQLRCHARIGAERAVRRAAAELDGLLGPLGGSRALVVVPVGVLHGVPWAALPSCRGRAVSVAPSVGAWLRAVAADRAVGGGRVWLAGPGSRHARGEAASLHAAHGGVLRTGRAATVPAALAAMDGADLVHVAAHGRFREDQPLFSCVELADGPLYGYDVQRLPRPPRRVVLSACDTGRATVWPGGDVIGMATALLRCGTATVIASVLPVPDRQAVPLVTALHAGLAAGPGPAQALADAQAQHGDLGFVCFGA